MKDERVSNTAKRLTEIMKERNIKQVDIVRLCAGIYGITGEKIDKSHVSQWLHGVNEPSQRKLTTLALALEVSEPWLMGYDVKKERGYNEPTMACLPFGGVIVNQIDNHTLLRIGINHLNNEEAKKLLEIANVLFPGKFDLPEDPNHD